MRVIFDIETDGLLRAEGEKPEATKIHCLVIKDVESGASWSCTDAQGVEDKYFHIFEGLMQLGNADEVIGHNILTFDLPILEKFFPEFKLKAGCKVTDTLTISQLIWSDLTDLDYRLAGKTKIPNHCIGKHRLEAWGHRLGLLKGNFNNDTTDWSKWSQQMQTYCELDVDVNEKLFRLIESKKYSAEAIELEHDFQRIIFMQEQNGFAFDEKYAQGVYSKMAASRDELKRKLQEVFPPRIETMKTPDHYLGEVFDSGWVVKKFATKGEALKAKASDIKPGPMRTKTHPFNPDSGLQVADRLTEVYGWKPSSFTPSGQAKVGDEVLSELDFPEAKLLCEYAILGKRIAQIAEGEQGWLKHVKGGRLYGSMTTNGAVTGRCTHRLVVNVPKAPEPWGLEMRSCFISSPGWWLGGCDAAGLEARVQGHFQYPYDNGAFAKAVLSGKKSEGTNVHSLNRAALGLEPTDENYDKSKTWYYAFLYGCGNFKSGITLGITDEEVELYSNDPQHSRSAQAGAKWLKKNNLAVNRKNVALCIKGGLKKRLFLERSPSLAKLIEDIQSQAKMNGYLIGLDGRRLNVRSAHAALNTLFQSGGAIVMKKALIILYQELTKRGWKYGTDYRFVANVHDEIQYETPSEEQTAQLGALAADSIAAAGRYFKFRCPLEGEFKVGKNWHETH